MTCALMCIGSWSLLEFLKPKDLHAVTIEAEVEGEEEELPDGWDSIFDRINVDTM